MSILDVICPATSLRRQQAGNRQEGNVALRVEVEGKMRRNIMFTQNINLIFKTLYHLQSKLISVVQRGVRNAVLPALLGMHVLFPASVELNRATSLGLQSSWHQHP